MDFRALPVAAIAAMPAPLLALPTKLVFSRVITAHPNLFDRLGDHINKTFAFVLSDLPFAFIIQPAQKSIEVCSNVIFKNGKQHVDAEIEGPLSMLLALAEGQIDADALFFSRDLVATGDMEAMIALRNALDDNAIDLPSDLAGFFGPFKASAVKLLNFLRQQLLENKEKRWN